MKILKKSEANAEAARLKRQQIDEGMELAQRIDGLRRTRAEVEAQHAEYAKGLRASLEREIAPLVETRNELQVQVSAARRELEKLRVPLDGEWASARAQRTQLESDRTDLDAREIAVSNSEELVRTESKAVADERRAVSQLRAEADSELAVASDAKGEAYRILKNAKVASEASSEAMLKRERAVSESETRVALREADAQNREDSIYKRNKALDDRERFINDKYQTLLRTQEHGIRKR